MINTSVAEYLFYSTKEEKASEQMAAVLAQCENTKVAMLWKILFETDVYDAELLETRIFEFGSMIKDDDSWGRDIFMCLVAFLNLVIK